jgi:ApaG protein
VDGDGVRHAVAGEGVIGQQPSLQPGERFEYQSFTPLMTHWGTMEGAFTFERSDHTAFDARVERFFLVSPEPKRRK